MLVIQQSGQEIGRVQEGGKFSLPNGDVVSPAYAGWTSGDFALVTAPPPPAPNPEEILATQRADMRLTFAQLLIGLVAEGWITQAEGEAWLAGTLPAPVTALIDTLPAEQQFAAKARAIAPSAVLRSDPLVNALGAAQGKTPEQLDAFFQTYAQV